MAYSQVTGMRSTRSPLSGCGCGGGGANLAISGLGQMTWPGLFGMEPRLLAATTFAAGALTMHLMHRYKIMKNPGRRRRYRRR